jgi:lysozyme
VIKGIDVSVHQRGISWSAIKRAGIEFAFVKATEGVGFVDSAFERHRTEARRVGIPLGAYHFARPDTNVSERDPIAEADHFLDVVEPREGDLLPVLDLETPGLPPSRMAAWAKAWLKRVAAGIGERPILYTFTSFWTDRVGNSDAFTRFPLWLANYGPNDGRVHRVSPVGGWKRIAVHQFSSRGRIEGFDGDLDLNRLMEGSTLANLTLGEPPPPRPGFGPPWSIRARGEVLHEARGRALGPRFVERVEKELKERGSLTLRGTRR